MNNDIFLSDVKQDDEGKHYNLLRSSEKNIHTHKFSDTDNKILRNVNEIAPLFFEKCSNFNHAYCKINNNDEEKKSFKSIDMNQDSLIAFTTFYKSEKDKTKLLTNNKQDVYDWHYKGNLF